MSDSTSAANIVPLPLTKALKERYLAYALSTIVSRSLPDVRDGLKPVHRRLIHVMGEMRLVPGSAPHKSASVVGKVMGDFHPHGDAAIYDALVRLAQDFALRYPLVDGQGNFGNIDGDSAAAMRYTEARMTKVAQALLDGIDEDTVDFRETYDGNHREPVVLPAAFPNLLANGAQGIAVGMATSIPPHNVGELCAAMTHMIDHPDWNESDLLAHVKGPDFPTGGVLVEPAESVAEAYLKGRGSFRVRSSWAVEKLAQGQYQIVVTEIPYQVQKSRLIEKLADLIATRKVPMLEDVRDESAEDVRIVLVPRSRNVDATALMEHLFRLSDLESRIGLNLNVLDADQVPKVMSLGQALRAFLDHRHVVLVRRTEYRLGKIDQRLDLLHGYLVAHLNIDEVIAIIREHDEPKPELMARFDLNDAQAEAILNMRLRALRKLEEMELKREQRALRAERKDLKDLLGDEGRRWRTIRDEIAKTAEEFGGDAPGGARRTGFADAPSGDVVPLEAMIEREPITVYLSAKGWVRAVKGHQEAGATVKYKEGDRERFVLHAETTDKLLIFATNGRFYTIGADKLPRGRGFGEPVRLMVDLPNEADIVAMRVHRPDGKLLVASHAGRGFVVAEAEVAAQTRAGKQVLSLSGNDEAAALAPVAGDRVAVLGENRKLLVFPLDEVPEMARGKGVILQRYKDGGLADLAVFHQQDGLSWGRRTLTGNDLMAYVGKRASAGRLVAKGLPKASRFA